MIHEVEGDILLSGAAAIAHGVAPSDKLSHGLALSLRERWPAMAKDYRHWCHQVSPKPGEAWIWSGVDGRIINLLTQDAEGHGGHPGKATLPNVNHALKALRKLMQEEDIRTLALPRLATGVGGLDWAEVQPLITHHLGDLDADIYVYTTYHAGMKATEGAGASD